MPSTVGHGRRPTCHRGIHGPARWPSRNGTGVGRAESADAGPDSAPCCRWRRRGPPEDKEYCPSVVSLVKIFNIDLRVLLCAACGRVARHWRSRLRTDRNWNGWSVQARRSSASRCGLGLFLARRTVNRTTRWPRHSRRRVRPCWIGGSALPKAGYKLCMGIGRAGGVSRR